MKKTQIAFALMCVIALVLATVPMAQAVSVNSTVETKRIALIVDTTDIPYGIADLGAQVLSGSIVATNTGNVPEQFTCSFGDATNGVNTWTAASSPGVNQFAMVVVKPGPTYVPLAGSTETTFATGVAPLAAQQFSLGLGMPSAGSWPGQFSWTVSLTAWEN